MMKFALKAVLFVSAAALMPVSAQAATTIGNADSGNCYPFSCGPTDGVTHYQQAYNSAAFPGPLTFNTVSFTSFDAFKPGPLMDSATYTINFYLSSVAFGSLSSDLLSNRGTLLGSLGVFALGGLQPDVLSLTGNTIDYDPLDGVLLMDVTVSDVLLAQGTYQNFFDSDQTGSDTTRAYVNNSGENGDQVSALQTTFDLVDRGAVPEPSTWAMMILGFGLVGGAMRRRSRQQADVRFAF